MKSLRRLFNLFLTAVLLMAAAPMSKAETAPQSGETTVLFTHDLHSHFLPQKTADGGESGGYARLKTALDQERIKNPSALVLDAGDFSMGSLIQNLYTTQAAELRTMGAMGYDAVTAGNHEFDLTGIGFAQMLSAADRSGDRQPALLMANYSPARENPDQLDIQRQMAAYGVKDAMLLEKGGITYGIFGLMGLDSNDCAPNSGFVLEDRENSAKQCVDTLRQQGAQFVICLSHGGTNEKKKLSEDELLAEHVKGIDLIVSGHTHTTLEEPIVVGDTYIVSAGAYCENLGVITVQWSEDGSKTLSDYRLIPIDQTLAEDPGITSWVEEWKSQVSSGYLSQYNFTYDQVLVRSDFDLLTPSPQPQAPNALGGLVADAYAWAVSQVEGKEGEPVAVAVTPAGVLRAGLLSGDITVSHAFDVLSLGVGADGSFGYPLVSCYLTGNELRAMLEVDASVSQLMPSAQLYTNGISYSMNLNRMLFNRVTKAGLDGGPIENNRLYRVVTGLYSAQMLGMVKNRSMGLLTLEPKDRDGNPITDFSQHIIRDQTGNELKEWYALAAYLASFSGENGTVGQLPQTYQTATGGKEISHSWNPIELLKNLNWITAAAFGVLLLGTSALTGLTRWGIRGRRRRRYGAGDRRHRRWLGR